MNNSRKLLRERSRTRAIKDILFEAYGKEGYKNQKHTLIALINQSLPKTDDSHAGIGMLWYTEANNSYNK